MDSSTILGIAGLAATIVLGGYSIYLVFRTQKYPGRITFVRESCIGLFDAVVRNLSELSIQYRDAPVGENLVLLKGCLLNTGTKDISPDMVEEPITATLPDGLPRRSFPRRPPSAHTSTFTMNAQSSSIPDCFGAASTFALNHSRRFQQMQRTSLQSRIQPATWCPQLNSITGFLTRRGSRSSRFPRTGNFGYLPDSSGSS